METDIQVLSYLAQFILQWEMLHTGITDKITAHISCSVTSFQTLHRLWDKVEKYCRAVHATDEDIAQAHCVLGT